MNDTASDDESRIAALEARATGMEKLADERDERTRDALGLFHHDFENVRVAINRIPTSVRDAVKAEVAPVRKLAESNRLSMEKLAGKIHDWRLVANVFRTIAVFLIGAFVWGWANIEGFGGWILTRLKS